MAGAQRDFASALAAKTASVALAEKQCADAIASQAKTNRALRAAEQCADALRGELERIADDRTGRKDSCATSADARESEETQRKHDTSSAWIDAVTTTIINEAIDAVADHQ